MVDLGCIGKFDVDFGRVIGHAMYLELNRMD